MCKNIVPFFRTAKNSIFSIILFAISSSVGCRPNVDMPEQPRNERKQVISRAPTDQGSPAELLRKLHSAIVGNDYDKFRECHNVPQSSAAIFDAIFACLVAQSRFVAAIEKAYGQEGLNQYWDITTAKAGMYIVAPPRPASRWWEAEDFSLRIEAGQARFVDPYCRRERTMSCTDGIWRIDFEAPDPKVRAADYQMLADILLTCSADIGKPGVTIDDIRSKTGRLEEEGFKKLATER